ncbi:MAG: hypothetical protein EOM20_10805 [Spartobacteria bacterium]|nr:hypothetical protein [Spartobacteria bacterium]
MPSTRNSSKTKKIRQNSQNNPPEFRPRSTSLSPEFLAFPGPASITFLLIFGTLYGILLYRVTRNYITRERENKPSGDE